MTEAIGSILGNAVGVAISPVPVIALILMLFSRSAARNSLSFLLGWVLGLLGVGLIMLALDVEGGSHGSSAGGWLKVALGVLLLLLGGREWRSRPRGAEEPAMPGWMSAIDGFTAARSVGLGLLLTVANPKNVGLTIAAAVNISGAGLSTGGEIVVLVVFVGIGSITVAGPVIYYLVAGERADAVLDAAKAWLTANNATVMTLLFAVLGAKVLGDGLTTLG